MPATTHNRPAAEKTEKAPPTRVGWQGVTFTLPPDWNITGFSMDRADGYVKVDSPGTMFAQVKWLDPAAKRPANLADAATRLWRWWRERRGAACEPAAPDLRETLDTFLKQTARKARTGRGKAGFDYKVKGEVTEAGGERVAHHFSWSGGGQGQGKIWRCARCRRVVIAQVVGQARDPVGDVAAQLFGSLRDHGEDGWEAWALYDMVAAVPDDFRLRAQKLMSGYLRLEFERRGERIVLERWGLASVALKKFTLAEWFRRMGDVPARAAVEAEETDAGHAAVWCAGSIRGPLAWARALRDAAGSLRPASRYAARCWTCEESNKVYAVQVWHNRRTEGLLEEVAARCQCH